MRQFRRAHCGSVRIDETYVKIRDCRIITTVSHTIFIGEAVGIRLPEQTMSPLLYLDGAFVRCAPAEKACQP
ncbi:flavin reductase (DIM6/NTAB) family NADH-FMN oxidoreductase RutF [Neorhizobium galegae]|nr:flavin reductase (DIM6/NTAB) family NADH-FMN oxidoreductase RutF [Neorhizobium galegae]